MTVSYFVFYQGVAENNDEFEAHYRTKHAAILATFPGLLDLRIHRSINWDESQAVTKGGFLLIAEMIFPDQKTMETAIASPERAFAREDFENFIAFDGKIWHQAMKKVDDKV
jgi:uncharacterized protein (TIGR02118 family)